MKLKEYISSLVSRRKSNTSSKSHKSKSHQESVSSADCQYEVCGPNDTHKVSTNDRHNRTQFLLARHAHLVDTIVGTHSQENSCLYCRGLYQPEQQNLLVNCNYSNTFGSCNSHRECQHQTHISSSNNSLWTQRQRSKIRTNPWIKNTHTTELSQTRISSGLIHSESFPQTISNGNIRSTNPSNRILHRSDSGHGFSLSSSRIIDSSSTENASNNDELLLNKKHHVLYSEQYSAPKTIPSDNKRKVKKSTQSRYQRSPNTQISSLKKPYINRKNHSRSSSPPLHNDHFSLQFEEIVENQRLRSSPSRKTQFILPLDETDVRSSSPLPILYQTTLKKSNSRTILKHIEEIENEIQMIKNLNFDQDEQILSLNVYPKQNDRQIIHEQIDHWIEQCLTTTKNNSSTNLLHTECNHLSNTIKDYVTCICSNDNSSKISSLPKSTELMTAFYLSSTPSAKRTFSFINQPSQLSNSSQTITKDLKSIHECPF